MNIKKSYQKHSRIQLDFPQGSSLTKQQFADECNINKIVSKHVKTGVINHINNHQGTYGDIPSIDYTESMQLIASANTMFQELPAAIREKFSNSAANFLQFAEDPDNSEEMLSLGLSNQIEPSLQDSFDILSDHLKEAHKAEPVPATKPDQIDLKTKVQ